MLEPTVRNLDTPAQTYYREKSSFETESKTSCVILPKSKQESSRESLGISASLAITTRKFREIHKEILESTKSSLFTKTHLRWRIGDKSPPTKLVNNSDNPLKVPVRAVNLAKTCHGAPVDLSGDLERRQAYHFRVNGFKNAQKSAKHVSTNKSSSNKTNTMFSVGPVD